VDCQCSSICCLSTPWSLPWQPLKICRGQAQVPVSGCEEPCLANWLAVLFPSIPVCPATYTSWTTLCSASFTRDWWQSETKITVNAWALFIWQLASAFTKRIQCYDRQCSAYRCTGLP
jgi:hypothetical protein